MYLEVSYVQHGVVFKEVSFLSDEYPTLPQSDNTNLDT